jgi:hypothetical protein
MINLLEQVNDCCFRSRPPKSHVAIARDLLPRAKRKPARSRRLGCSVVLGEINDEDTIRIHLLFIKSIPIFRGNSLIRKTQAIV